MTSIQPSVMHRPAMQNQVKCQAPVQFGNHDHWETKDLNQALVSLLGAPLGVRFDANVNPMKVELASVDRFLTAGIHPGVVPNDRSRELCDEALGKITPLLDVLQSIKGKLDTIKSRGQST